MTEQRPKRDFLDYVNLGLQAQQSVKLAEIAEAEKRQTEEK